MKYDVIHLTCLWPKPESNKAYGFFDALEWAESSTFNVWFSSTWLICWWVKKIVSSNNLLGLE